MILGCGVKVGIIPEAILFGGGFSVMLIVAGNEIGDLGKAAFPFTLMPLRKAWIHLPAMDNSK